MTSISKQFAISNLIGGDLADGGAWAAFNYTLDDATAPSGANPIQGSFTIIYGKSGTALKAVLIQMSVTGRAITPHQCLESAISNR